MVNIVERVIEISGAPGTTDSNGGDFDLLRDAVIAADLDGALSDPAANLTVFAPNDTAFVNLAGTLGYGGTDEAGSLGYIVDALTLLGQGDATPLLQSILTYHVVGTEIFSSAVIPANDGLEIGTLQGGILTLDTVADGPDDNNPGLDDLDPGLPDPTIIAVDEDVDNGVIHTLDGVLLPLAVSAILTQPGTDFIIGDDGNDRYYTRGGNDFIDGNGGRDVIFAGSGNDVAIGGEGNDRVFGGRGNDIVLGEAGHDKLFGGSGRDVIDGGEGNDILNGGGGRDTFVFNENSGHDKILFFQNGRDKLDVSGYGIESFDQIEHDIKAGFFNTKIEFDDTASVTLVGTWKSQIDEGDFIFA